MNLEFTPEQQVISKAQLISCTVRWTTNPENYATVELMLCDAENNPIKPERVTLSAEDCAVWTSDDVGDANLAKLCLERLGYTNIVTNNN